MKKSNEIPVGFRIDEVLYKRLRTIAIAEKTPVKQLLCKIITAYVESVDPDKLIEKVMSIDPSERLNRVFEQQTEEE